MENGYHDKMILVVKLCKEKMHDLEFVKPIEDILIKNDIEFNSLFYKNLDTNTLLKTDKVILSGTSLLDNDFSDNLDYFHWIKNLKKPILGICGGFQILGLMFNGRKIKSEKIGLSNIYFDKEFLGVKGKLEVYELHNYSVKSKEYENYAISDNCPKAIKHKKMPFYGVLFHPEVRNKNIIVEFSKL